MASVQCGEPELEARLPFLPHIQEDVRPEWQADSTKRAT